MSAKAKSDCRSGWSRPARSLRRAGLLLLLALGLTAVEGRAQGYGSAGGWRFVLDHDEGAGVVAGVRRYHTRYGYRRVTWIQRLDVVGLVSARGGVEADVHLQRRLGSSGAVLAGRAGAGRRLRSYRFFGYGNDRPLIDAERALVPLDEAWLEATLELPVGTVGAFTVGPIYRHVHPRGDPRGPLARDAPLGSRPFGQAGLLSRFEVQEVDDEIFPRRGLGLLAGASAYAPVLSAPEWFGDADLELRGYLPLPLGSALAARARGASTLGRAPAHEAAFLGGAESLRGHRHQRFAGDAAVFGSLELRAPLLSFELFAPARIGALALADAGRVFHRGESPGGWHTARGGGLWYHTRGVTVTGLYARGEEGRAHVYLGLPF